MPVDAPASRIYPQNRCPISDEGKYVLYWMIASRRTRYNFALDRALYWSRTLRKPLLVFEPLRCGYRWASDRLHQFVIDGMRDNEAGCAKHGITYFPYLEPQPGQGSGLLEQLAASAGVVVTDEFPCFFLPAMVKAAAAKLPVLLESVDASGLYPLSATDVVFSSAHQFRRHLQKHLPPFLDEFPSAHPFRQAKMASGAKIDHAILKRWPTARLERFQSGASALSEFPIDHHVAPAPLLGGAQAASKRLKHFLTTNLNRYQELRNDPNRDAASGLSPYLHFGHISVHEIFHEAVKREHWSPAKLNPKAHGSREDWWRTSPALEAFLDELVTWRELGYHYCARVPEYAEFETLPPWAKDTLKKHAKDKRPVAYSLEQFENAQTHDALWNAAQRQLLREGKIQNYLRMLWGKKILEWSKHPREALEIMIELNNKYALDGRDPNSYSGIFWTLGRFDRPWGPERPIFGTVRYMSSENTAKKLHVDRYLAAYGLSPSSPDSAQAKVKSLKRLTGSRPSKRRGTPR